ncbi:MAG: DUF2905 family protein [Chlamydiota bacterium]
MGRFLALAVLLVVAIGLTLHFRFELPSVLNWMGTLPGDLIIKKGSVTLYVPLTTSVLISVVLSLILSLLFGQRK